VCLGDNDDVPADLRPCNANEPQSIAGASESFVIQAIVHREPAAFRDESLLRLQADEEWALLTEHRMHHPVSVQNVNIDRTMLLGWSQHSSSAKTNSSLISMFSAASIISAAGSRAKCYALGTCFRTSVGDLVKVEDIKIGDKIMAFGVAEVTVSSTQRHRSMDRNMVWLGTDGFEISLTHDHRVMVVRGTQRQTIPAGHLQIGDEVLGASGPQVIRIHENYLSDDDVFEIVFTPDAEMETIYLGKGDNLLTKGRRIQTIANRRGGMNRSSGSQSVNE